MPRTKVGWVGLVCAFAFMAAGCRHQRPDKSSFKTAINDYYSARPECVWTTPVKFPAQADTSNDNQTKGFDALTDAGLLTRTPEQKKRFLIGSKQVNDYDISGQGRSAWTADQSQPGYGNFCFGHRDVTSVDTFSTGNPNGVATAVVNYHYDLAAVPDWAKSAEMQTAFPQIQTGVAGSKTATANLVQTSNGWQVKPGS